MIARSILFIYDCVLWLSVPLYFAFALVSSLGRPSVLAPHGARFGWTHALSALPRRAIWLHAVSVGEVAATAIMIPELQKLAGATPVILSCTTRSGYLMARKKLGAAIPLFYAPVDIKRVVRRFFRMLEPRALAVAEIEIWPNLFFEAAKRGVPLAIYNARMPDGDWARYRRLKTVFSRVLGCARMIAAQSAEDAARYCDIGAPMSRVIVTGNIKADLVAPSAPGKIVAACGLDDGRLSLVLASSHRGEERLVLRALAQVAARGQIPGSGLRLIIVPRHIHRARAVARTARRAGYAVRMRGRCDGRGLERGDEVLVVDTFGELVDACRVASFVIMGGSFKKRVQGHNPLEAAAVSRPLVLGPEMNNFRDSRDALVAAGGAVVAGTVDELAARIGDWLASPESVAGAGRAARGAFEKMQGAARRTALVIANLLR